MVVMQFTSIARFFMYRYSNECDAGAFIDLIIDFASSLIGILAYDSYGFKPNTYTMKAIASSNCPYPPHHYLPPNFIKILIQFLILH